MPYYRILPEFRIVEIFKTKYIKNNVSGHEYPAPGKTTGYQVKGGLYSSHIFKSLQKAEKDLEECIEFYSKFPQIVYRSEREVEKAKKLGIPLGELVSK